MTDAENPKINRAWVWRKGPSPLDLCLEEQSLAPLTAGDVLVRNAAIGLNPVDWKVLGGSLVDWQAGKVPGVDGAGTVVAVGDDVDAGWLGQRVAYHQSLQRPGSFAEYTPVKARVLMRVPASLDFALAASVPCPALTAWQAIDKLPDPAERDLLISGAGGAVGNYLVQIAARRGWRVSALCHPRHRERLHRLGAQDCNSDVEAIPTRRFHAVVDCVSPEQAAALAPHVEANGHLLCIQGRVPAWPTQPFSEAISLHEVALGALHRFGDANAWARLTSAGEALFAAIANGTMQAEPLVTRDFDALPQLLDALRQRNFSGKPVVTL